MFKEKKLVVSIEQKAAEEVVFISATLRSASLIRHFLTF
jgi:hypothetical protein